jgi:hypothetical protein
MSSPPTPPAAAPPGLREVKLHRDDTNVSFGFALASQKNGDKIVVTVRTHTHPFTHTHTHTHTHTSTFFHPIIAGILIAICNAHVAPSPRHATGCCGQGYDSHHCCIGLLVSASCVWRLASQTGTAACLPACEGRGICVAAACDASMFVRCGQSYMGVWCAFATFPGVARGGVVLVGVALAQQHAV